MALELQESNRLEHRALLPVCVVDDDPSLLEVITLVVKKAGFPATSTSDPEGALRGVRDGQFKAVLVDIKMPKMDGFTFLDRSIKADPSVSVILVTGFYSIDSAIDAVKRGATDYLAKPVDRARLFSTLDEQADLLFQKQKLGQLEERILENSAFEGIVGKSVVMLEVFDRVRDVAKHYVNVLVTGPPGSGKEVVSRALHSTSPHRTESFQTYICSAFEDSENVSFRPSSQGAANGSSELLASIQSRKAATIYLDEIGDMPARFQTRLLQAIHDQTSSAGPRIVSASRQNMRQEVAAGRFREDLFFRLGPIEIRVPTLAERGVDLPLLSQFFLKKYNASYGKHFRGLTRRAQIALINYSWPGNVRELENTIAGAMMVGNGNFVDVTDLPSHIQKPPKADAVANAGWKPATLEEARRDHIERVLGIAGNLTQAAEMLGISRTSLYRLSKRYFSSPKSREPQ